MFLYSEYQPVSQDWTQLLKTGKVRTLFQQLEEAEGDY